MLFRSRMTGEDLLEERGARARQPDNESRLGGLTAEACARGEELTRVQRLRTLYEPGSAVGIVNHRGAPQRVAAGVMREGCSGVSGILERLAERELELQAIVVPEVLPRQLRLHGRDIAGAEAEGLQVREAEPG